MSLKTARNIGIVAVVALAVAVLPGGGDTARLVLGALSLAFLAAIGFLGYRLYMENRFTLWSMTMRHRAMLYGGVAAGGATLIGTSRLWESGFGTMMWFVLLGGSGLAVYYAWVEFLAVLPVALLLALAGWQLALAGQAVWLAGNAARAAARAQAVGRDPGSAARSALPSYLRRGLVVHGDGGRVSVRVAVPLLLRRWRTPLRVGASAALDQR